MTTQKITLQAFFHDFPRLVCDDSNELWPSFAGGWTWPNHFCDVAKDDFQQLRQQPMHNKKYVTTNLTHAVVRELMSNICWFVHFRASFFSGEGRRVSRGLRGLEIPHSQQQSQIVLLAPHQGRLSGRSTTTEWARRSAPWAQSINQASACCCLCSVLHYS